MVLERDAKKGEVIPIRIGKNLRLECFVDDKVSDVRESEREKVTEWNDEEKKRRENEVRLWEASEKERRDKQVVDWTKEQEERMKKLQEEMKIEVQKQIDEEVRHWR